MASRAFHWDSLAVLEEIIAAVPFYLLRAGHHPLGAGGMASTDRGGLTSWVVVIVVALGVLGLVFLIRKPKR